MKQISTLIQRIAALAVVLVMALNVNAADRTFATLAEMHAATDLAEGDEVTITNDVVFEYSYQYYFVISDKGGNATCANNYSYYFPQLLKNKSLKAGDVFKNYKGKVSISKSGVYRLEPSLSKDGFKEGTTIVPSEGEYEIKTVTATLKDLLANPAAYDGKVIALGAATIKASENSASLVQGTDTLAGFTIEGLNPSDYPSELIINCALFRVDMNGRNTLGMRQADYDVTYKSVKSLKTTNMTENIELDLTVQVLKKESYEGKTYLTVYQSTGDRLVNCAGLRILLNTENATDKDVKVGDVVKITSATGKYQKSLTQGIYFTPSLLTLDAHETVIEKNEPIAYFAIPYDDISMLESFEFLPVSIEGELTFTKKENAEHKEHNFAQAQLEDKKIYVDITKKPENVETTFFLRGLIEIPLWKGKVSNTYIVPFSEKDFMTGVMSFDNIEAVVSAGTPDNSLIKYQINSDMTITGIEHIAAVGEEDQSQNIVFVQDGTAPLMLVGKLGEEYKVGDAITGVTGYYNDLVKTQITSDGARDFGKANRLELDSASTIKKGSIVTGIIPQKVTVKELLADDNLASHVVELSDFTVDSVLELVQDITVLRYYLYQGEDSIAISKEFFELEDKTNYVAIYYLNGFYSQLLPYDGAIGQVAVENVAEDKDLFVANNIVYAQGAEIEVYDVVGRMIAAGINAVSLENAIQSVFVVRTKYLDGQVFVTKIANR